MKKMNNKGFSLVELIVVIAIMAVLIGVLAPTLLGNIEKSKLGTDKEAINQLYKAVEIASSEGGFTVDTTQTIQFKNTTNNVLSFKPTSNAAVDSGDQAAFEKAIYEYIGAEETKLKSKYYKKGITIDMGFNNYGKPVAEITQSLSGSDTSGNFTINE